MIVYYRLADKKSEASAKPPILEDDNYALNALCLKSYILGYSDLRPKTVFICDNCPREKYMKLLERFPWEHEIKFTELGINGTALLQYDLAKDQRDDVLFQECDYLTRPVSGKLMRDAIKKYKLISPYDHKNFYIDRSIHSQDCKIDLMGEQHWRTTERNTMTFGMTNEALQKNFDILKKYGYLDNDVWHEMRDNGYPLWTPIPSIATHMVKDYMAPGIIWERLWEQLLIQT